MAELAMLADIQRTVYPKEVSRQLHVMAQARESSPVIDQRSNHCATPPTVTLTQYVCPLRSKDTSICGDTHLQKTRRLLRILSYAVYTSSEFSCVQRNSTLSFITESSSYMPKFVCHAVVRRLSSVTRAYIIAAKLP